MSGGWWPRGNGVDRLRIVHGQVGPGAALAHVLQQLLPEGARGREPTQLHQRVYPQRTALPLGGSRAEVLRLLVEDFQQLFGWGHGGELNETAGALVRHHLDQALVTRGEGEAQREVHAAVRLVHAPD